MQLKSILTPSWIWYMVHNLPIIYLTADAKCSTVNERIASILHGQMWDHLYDSLRDGASLNRFQHHIFGYKSPLIMLFEISDGYVFCLCCDEDFKESPKHFGGVHSRLIQLKPVLKILQEGPNIIFMNTKLRGVSSLGLHIGRDLQHTFLTIDGDFFNATHINGEGRLSAIEVWGCGGTKAAQEQGNMRQWEAKQIEKLRKVKNDYATEEVILNLGGVQTRHGYDQNPN
ncbi:unnamed protein product [Didymodactylos carnosus]|uniref:TLDc domain-containing protein n=1 Tax=Didymodactylos carnosus TaxID=1234261 RepID=A0A813QGI5_9BILA|nr:unnamed protein product [Didymodactylos carnosus]CAF0819607.1 unnamed protein product [Didymodactylos carnosus]CAF3549336.1 unnamed protein product [Didymodactylos carnosus]CAF3603799.1 unnamed protein product [Didymodactylos carnosus]